MVDETLSYWEERMKRTAVMVFILSFILCFAFVSSIISEDDPFAGMDTGADPMAGMDTGADPMAGMDTGADPMAGMDAGGADVLMPDAGGADNGALPGEAGGALPGETGASDALLPGDIGMDTGAPGGGALDMGAGMPDGPAQPAGDMGLPALDVPAAKPAAKPAGPATKKGETKTNDIYTKSSYIGGYRHLKDIMDWGVKATSSLSPEHSAAMLSDNIIDTAWIEAKKDGGKKQAVTFLFDEKYFIGLYEKKFRKAQIGKMQFLNGFATDKNTWKKYFRVKKLKITQNGKLKFYIVLHDTMNWQTVTMKKPLIIKPGDKIRMEIMEAYPEVRREDDTYVAMTEVTFIGAPYGDKVEPKYIQPHLQGME
jgi:hypothetical protein